jgi:hypothetical protein
VSREGEASIASVFATTMRNGSLLRQELERPAFNWAEWAVWVCLLVYAYSIGGATAACVMALLQLILRVRPAGDDSRGRRVLFFRGDPLIDWKSELIDCGADLAEVLIEGIEPVYALGEHALITAKALLDEHAGWPAAAGFAAASWHGFGVPYEEAQALLGQGPCLLVLGSATISPTMVDVARLLETGGDAER